MDRDDVSASLNPDGLAPQNDGVERPLGWLGAADVLEMKLERQRLSRSCSPRLTGAQAASARSAWDKTRDSQRPTSAA
jgi:hypothetical protein